MAVPNALIRWPVRLGASSYLLRVVISGNAQSLTFIATAGRDYWMAGDGAADSAAGEGDALDRLRACIASHTSNPTVTVGLTADHRVVVSVASGTVQLLWEHGTTTLPADVFGFTTDTAAAASVTGPRLPHGICPIGAPYSEDSLDRVPVLGALSESMTGLVRVSSFGVQPAEREVVWDLLEQERVLSEFSPADEPTGAFEYAWLQRIARGERFRLHDDESSAAYRVYRTRSLADPMERSEAFEVWWSVRLAMRRVP